VKLEKENLHEKLRELEKHVDIGLSEKKYELKGIEGLNKKVKDLNLYITELRKENENYKTEIS
jgi:hypothetical protein